MPQAGSRKRPAPGTSPVTGPANIDSTNYDIRPPQPSADQFFQWNHQNNIGTSSGYQELPEPLASPSFTNMASPAVRTEPANQLARRAGNNQMISRGPYGEQVAEGWPNAQPVGLEQQGNQGGGWQDDDTQLDLRAAEAKKQAQAARKSIPPFVQKLSSFLDESRNTELIRWSPKGDSFVVLDEDEFARTLIPELFKHNNYASFVRQLNMYGFHKKVGLSDNSMRASERKNKSPSEYFNPYFKRGRPNLLWLIQKPKPSAQGKKGRGKQDDNVDDEIDDNYDVEHNNLGNYGQEEHQRGSRPPLMIGQGEAGLAREELSAVHQELKAIRHQQSMISGVISKIRREHEQLYGQAQAFQDLHSRHENSINAILTFLATVYNRSLEGHNNQNIGNLFAGAIPHDLQQQGSVVDVGDFASPNTENHGTLVRRPSRRLLLQAPENGNSNVGMKSNDANFNQNRAQSVQTNLSTPTPNHPTPQNTGIVEEIYDQDAGTPVQSAFPKNNQQQAKGLSDADFMSFINSANARDNNSNSPGQMDFEQALSHVQNADGKSPLSPAQRSNVLRLMAGDNAQGSSNGNNNALTSPNPPNVPVPDMNTWNATDQDLQYLEKTLREQGDKVDQLSNMLQPLSPSGSIPGLDNPSEYIPPPQDGLDFNHIFNTDDYFTDPNNGNIDFGTSTNDFTNGGDFLFDNTTSNSNGNLAPPFGGDGANDIEGGRVVGTVDSSEATSPANTAEESGVHEETSSPRKRRRKN